MNDGYSAVAFVGRRTTRPVDGLESRWSNVQFLRIRSVRRHSRLSYGHHVDFEIGDQVKNDGTGAYLSMLWLRPNNSGLRGICRTTKRYFLEWYLSSYLGRTGGWAETRFEPAK